SLRKLRSRAQPEAGFSLPEDNHHIVKARARRAPAERDAHGLGQVFHLQPRSLHLGGEELLETRRRELWTRLDPSGELDETRCDLRSEQTERLFVHDGRTTEIEIEVMCCVFEI